MSNITYTDKVTLNKNPNIADVNKVKASDILRIRVGEEHATNNFVGITIEYTKNEE